MNDDERKKLIYEKSFSELLINKLPLIDDKVKIKVNYEDNFFSLNFNIEGLMFKYNSRMDMISIDNGQRTTVYNLMFRQVYQIVSGNVKGFVVEYDNDFIINDKRLLDYLKSNNNQSLKECLNNYVY